MHSKSNHPPSLIRNIPEAINKRLSEISRDEDAFNEAAPHYQEALRKSGYAYTLKFKPQQQRPPNQKHKRRRNIIWFNPPFNGNVKTSIGRAFINLLDKCFPTGNKLRKIFNRNTVKLSYSCTPNMKQVIDGHNKAILKNAQNPEENQPKKMCNCRNEKECPLEGECLQNEIVYQATVTTRGVTGTTEMYVGLTATDFKTRWRNHQMSFKHEKRRNDTELSKHLWKLKEKKEGYSISWKIIAKAKAYSNTTKRCNLCITEKFFILSNPQMATLNKRNELISNSRHRRKYILKYS